MVIIVVVMLMVSNEDAAEAQFTIRGWLRQSTARSQQGCRGFWMISSRKMAAAPAALKEPQLERETMTAEGNHLQSPQGALSSS